MTVLVHPISVANAANAFLNGIMGYGYPNYHTGRTELFPSAEQFLTMSQDHFVGLFSNKPVRGPLPPVKPVQTHPIFTSYRGHLHVRLSLHVDKTADVIEAARALAELKEGATFDGLDLGKEATLQAEKLMGIVGGAQQVYQEFLAELDALENPRDFDPAKLAEVRIVLSLALLLPERLRDIAMEVVGRDVATQGWRFLDSEESPSWNPEAALAAYFIKVEREIGGRKPVEDYI